MFSAAANSQSLEVHFSEIPGFYTSPVQLALNVDHPDALIRYTTDGSVPDQNSELYDSPLNLDSREGDPNVVSEIPTNNIGPGHPYRENWRPPAGEVFKIHTIRARAFLPNGTGGDVKTASYLVDENGTDRFSMPVFSITTEQDNFFGDEGIYVPGSTGSNFHQRGREWERDVHIEFFEDDGTLAFAQDAGARIHGGTTRNRPRKSLRLYARSDYGTSWFNYPLFPDKPVNRHKRFLLRNSGNDWSESVLRDAFMQTLIVNNMAALDKQHTRAAILFINGEYWGIHNIRDRYDHRYLQEQYGLDNERVTILGNNAEFDNGNPDGQQHYQDLYDFVLNSEMSDNNNFNYAANRMDMDNYIDYNIIHIYTRNTDWPGNNVRYWRYLDGDPFEDLPYGQDGRWRWMVFDLDFGFGLDFDYVHNSGSAYGGNNAQHNTLNFALELNGPDWPNPPWSTALLRNLMENEGFKNKFIDRFTDHLNTTFRADRVTAVLDSLELVYEAEIDEHIHRWREPSISHWENDLSVIREFAEQREDALRNMISNRFELGSSETITLSVNEPGKGTIKVNSMLLTSSVDGIDGTVFPWSGTYFSEQPVRVIAFPEAGYQFDGWTGDNTSASDTLYVTLDGAKQLTANFSEGGTFEGDEMNPEPFVVTSNDAYTFDHWSSEEPEGSFPPHMVFQQSSTDDPGINEPMTDPYFIPFIDENDNEYHANDQDKFGFPYMLTGRTRINGLGDDGISLINTGRGRDLGAVVLALDTRNIQESESMAYAIEWEAQTLEANSRVYHVRPQYRIGLTGEWKNFYEGDEIIEYERNENTSVTSYYQHYLEGEMLGQPYLQFRLKYYYTGTRLSEDSGQRDMIRLNNITTAVYGLSVPGPERPRSVELYQNYPNPFNPETLIRYQLPEGGDVRLEVFDLLGQKVADLVNEQKSAGIYEVRFDASALASGIYMYRLVADGAVITRRMTLIK